jgi:hypothetical protein
MKDKSKEIISRLSCLIFHRNKYLEVERFSTGGNMFYIQCSKCHEVYYAGKPKGEKVE